MTNTTPKMMLPVTSRTIPRMTRTTATTHQMKAMAPCYPPSHRPTRPASALALDALASSIPAQLAQFHGSPSIEERNITEPPSKDAPN
jgi:hypothetical protein